MNVHIGDMLKDLAQAAEADNCVLSVTHHPDGWRVAIVEFYDGEHQLKYTGGPSEELFDAMVDIAADIAMTDLDLAFMVDVLEQMIRELEEEDDE